MLPVNLFLRIHRSYIAAVDKIASFTNHDVEVGGKEIPIKCLYAHEVSKMVKTWRRMGGLISCQREIIGKL